MVPIFFPDGGSKLGFHFVALFLMLNVNCICLNYIYFFYQIARILQTKEPLKVVFTMWSQQKHLRSSWSIVRLTALGVVSLCYKGFASLFYYFCTFFLTRIHKDISCEPEPQESNAPQKKCLVVQVFCVHRDVTAAWISPRTGFSTERVSGTSPRMTQQNSGSATRRSTCWQPPPLSRSCWGSSSLTGRATKSTNTHPRIKNAKQII